MKKNLFSAPFSFIPEIKDEGSSIVPTIFEEIWNKDQLLENDQISSWIVNPGQSFIIDSQILDKYPKLKIIITPSTGTNHISLDDCEKRNIQVYSLLDKRDELEKITASSEFTFLLLLNTLRRLDIGIDEVSAQRWRKNEDILRGNELSGKNVGLVGFGRIGKNLSRYAKAFNSHVSFFDPYVNNEPNKINTLEELFILSDIICVCCILNKETYGVIDFDILKLMKLNSCLINTSRGEVINEKDLVRFISERPDIRVSLDVLSNETSGKQNESELINFHKEKKIVITPHISGATKESQLKAARTAFSLLREALEL